MSSTPADDFAAGPMCTSECLDCLREKAAGGDLDAIRALKLLRKLLHFLACRFLTGSAGDDCANRSMRKIPKEVADIIDAMTMTSGERVAMMIGGFIHRIIEDDDWDR